MDEQYVLGMDIGGTNLRCGLVDRSNRVCHFTVESSRQILECPDPIDHLIKFITDYCGSIPGGHKPLAVSLGFPSTIDRQRRVVVSTPNIASLQSLYIADRMENTFGIPVYVNRDVNFLLLYDMYDFKIEKQPVVLGIYIGTGLGNAICIDGRLLSGKNGSAGELGHIPLRGLSRRCGCGNTGCAETAAAGNHLERLQRRYYTKTPVRDLFSVHAQDARLRAFVDDVSITVAAEINIFDPDHVILGGGVLQMPGFPLALLEERIHLHVRKPFPVQNLSLLYSRPRQENGVAGAGIYAYRRLEWEDYL